MKRPLRVMTASALLVFCGALALSGCSGSTGSSASPSAHTAPADAKATGPVVIIDLRSAEDFKKGHLEGAETPEQAAVREIMEETGITGRVLRHLATIDYWFAGHEHRVHKVVHHFLLEAVSGTLTTENDPDHEAEDVEWVALDDVSHRLAYPNERRIVAAAWDILVGDG